MFVYPAGSRWFSGESQVGTEARAETGASRRQATATTAMRPMLTDAHHAPAGCQYGRRRSTLSGKPVRHAYRSPNECPPADWSPSGRRAGRRCAVDPEPPSEATNRCLYRRRSPRSGEGGLQRSAIASDVSPGSIDDRPIAQESSLAVLRPHHGGEMLSPHHRRRGNDPGSSVLVAPDPTVPSACRPLVEAVIVVVPPHAA